MQEVDEAALGQESGTVAVAGLAQDDDPFAGEEGAQRLEIREVSVTGLDRAQRDSLVPQPGHPPVLGERAAVQRSPGRNQGQP